MYKVFIVSLCLLVPDFVFAHGGDQPGPHGGKIEMPGAYHIEVVRKDLQTFNIYLLDINFENPTTQDSEISVGVTQNKNLKLQCQAQKEEFYICRSESALKKNLKLVVDSKRAGVSGNQAEFQFKGLKAK